MSAIFGLINLDGRAAAGRDLDLMGVALAAHGPDGSGVWTGEHVGLGQRLMCFTPEDRLERQPLVSAEGHHVLVTDGRIDNRPELMDELRIPSEEATGLPDSVFISRSYQKWGLDCCAHLIGDFVFALCDLHRGHVLIARSAMSNRSLYYHAAPRVFAFASAPKGLFALPWVPREIDLQNLADYLVQAPREPGRTLFAGLSELPSGQQIVVRREGFRLQRYWQPELRGEIRFPRDSDYVEAFSTLFKRVIADHLRSLTPVGVMISGGLDSSSVGVTAAGLLSLQGKRLAAFTEVPRAGFELERSNNLYADEAPFVQAIARKCDNLDLNFVRTEGWSLLDDIGPCLRALEVPYRAAWNRGWWEAILREASSQNVRVLLTGAPGNLTISRSGERLIPQLIRRGRWMRAFREARAFSMQDGGHSALRALAGGAAFFLPAPLWLAAARLARPNDSVLRTQPPWRAYSAIHPEFARSQRVMERASRKGYDFRFRARVQSPADRYEGLRRWEPGLQVTRGYEALFGVQTRNPTGDVRLVEFCLSLPEEQHRHNGVPRSLIRRAMKDLLPLEVLGNRRRGVQAADWFERAKADRSGMLDELTRTGHSELASTALDLKRTRELVQGIHESGAQGSETVNVHAILSSAFMTGNFIRWFESGMNCRESDRARA